MIFNRYYHTRLAQASYMLACEQSRVCVIVDPHRDVDFFIHEAHRERVTIGFVTETHIHADFVSGSRELAARTGARLLLSDEGGEDWRYSFAAESGAQLLHDGDELSFGTVKIRALHTPGHTPEHLCFLVTDLAVSNVPVGLLTGDFLFVGDVGRPDLLERAAGHQGTMESSARTLFRSLKTLATLPDHLQIWPGHGAGSACGKELGSMPQSTLGYERLSNWALSAKDEDEFVRGVLEGQPSPPRYFALMKRLNRDGPPPSRSRQAPTRLGFPELVSLADAGAVILDIRSTPRFEREHIQGSLHVPLGKSFLKWGGSVIPYDADLVILVGEGGDESAATAARELSLIGADRVAGFVTDGVIGQWKSAGRRTEHGTAVSPSQVAGMLEAGAVTLLDVRDASELAAGYVDHSTMIPLGALPERLDDVPTDKPVVVYCMGGSRAAIAASMLRRHNGAEVMVLSEGYPALEEAGLHVVTGA